MFTKITLSNGKVLNLETRVYKDRKVFDCANKNEALDVILTLAEIGNFCKLYEGCGKYSVIILN
jgi:hypothetical protein